MTLITTKISHFFFSLSPHFCKRPPPQHFSCPVVQYTGAATTRKIDILYANLCHGCLRCSKTTAVVDGVAPAAAAQTEILTTVAHLAATRHCHLNGRVLRTREVQKHLLERGLADAVVLNLVALPGALHRAEQARPRQVRVFNLIVHIAVMHVFERAAREGLFDELTQAHDALFHLFVRSAFHFGHDCVALAELVLQMLCTAQTLELSVHHDGHTCTQRLALLHAATQRRMGVPWRAKGAGATNLKI